MVTTHTYTHYRVKSFLLGELRKYAKGQYNLLISTYIFTDTIHPKAAKNKSKGCSFIGLIILDIKVSELILVFVGGNNSKELL